MNEFDLFSTELTTVSSTEVPMGSVNEPCLSQTRKIYEKHPDQSFDTKSINSPFRWPGGKFYARKIIESYFPTHQTYVEPFLGGGSIFFHKNKTKSYLNDFDEELINCYLHIRDNVLDLINILKDEIATKDRHSWYKNEFKPTNDLERAARYYYLNRTSYSGIMVDQNCYFGYGDKYSMRPENWPRQLLKNEAKLRNVEITNLDFEQFIYSLPFDQELFIFLDPPYYNADQDKFYRAAFTREDHHRLALCLKNLPKNVKFLLTYDNSPEVHELYDWADHATPHEWNYVISRTDDQKNKKKLKDGHIGERSKGKEIFFHNFKRQPQNLI
ncbi:MAG: DNA adenine methylase [Pseudomonadota bacterium]